MFFKLFLYLTANGLQLPEGGDLEAPHCQPSTNFDRSTKLDLTTEPPLLGRCCYAFALLSACQIITLFKCSSINAGSNFFSAINGIPKVLSAYSVFIVLITSISAFARLLSKGSLIPESIERLWFINQA